MLHASSKGTVPVLCVDNQVIDESLNIMFWALEQKDPNSWWQPFSLVQKEKMKIWIFKNDFEFKPWLDKYKYSSRFPEHAPDYYRQQCEDFLVLLENTLSSQSYLLGEHISLADVAIFPFIRQFSAVDHVWFDGSKYKAMRTWLHSLISMSLFESVMEKPS
jgi:glutathione S-transferase